MTMIEKMAIPIAKSLASTANYAFTASDSSDTGWENEMVGAREVARAALAVLLEPTGSIIDKGIFALDDCVDSDWDSGGDGMGFNSYTTIRSDAAATTFKAMIQAALDEK